MSSNSITLPAEYGQSENQNNLSQDEFYVQIHVKLLLDALKDLTHEDFAILLKLIVFIHGNSFNQDGLFKNKRQAAQALGIGHPKFLKVCRYSKDKNNKISNYLFIENKPLKIYLLFPKASGKNSKKTKGFIKIKKNHVEAFKINNSKAIHYALYIAILMVQQKNMMAESFTLNISEVSRIIHCNTRSRVNTSINEIVEILKFDYDQQTHQIRIKKNQCRQVKKDKKVVCLNPSNSDIKTKDIEEIANYIGKIDSFTGQNHHQLYDYALRVYTYVQSNKNIKHVKRYLLTKDTLSNTLNQLNIKPELSIRQEIVSHATRMIGNRSNRFELAEAFADVVLGDKEAMTMYKAFVHPETILEKFYPQCFESQWKYTKKITV